MKKKRYTKRRIKCLECGRRTTVYGFPNGFYKPVDGCNGWFRGTPPFRVLTEAELKSVSDGVLGYILFSDIHPGDEKWLDEFNAECLAKMKK